jgi:parallel beta-helix repeat protein
MVYAQTTTVSVNPRFCRTNVGSNVTITVNVTDVPKLFLWQIDLKYNQTIARCTSIWIPSDNVFAGHSFNPAGPVFGRDVVDGLNYVQYGNTLQDADYVNVTNGILCQANFTVEAFGLTNILIATEENPVHIGTNSWDVDYSLLGDVKFNPLPFFAESGAIATATFFVLTINATAGGTTNPEPTAHAYLANTTVPVTAVTTLGYYFDHWILDYLNVSSKNPYTVIMDANHTLLAVFVRHIPVTWTVSNTGPADFRTIQAAIDSPNVTWGDIISVKSGIYYEHISVTKKLTLIGEDRDNTIIDGNGTGTVVQLYGDESTITGFTIRDGDYGVQISRQQPAPPIIAQPFFAGCRVEDNQILDNRYGAISLEGSTNDTIVNNRVENNTLFGIHLWSSLSNMLVNNTIVNNGQGVDFYGFSQDNVLRNNTMNNNKYNFGVVLRGETLFWDDPRLLNNDVDDSNTVNGKPVCCWVDRRDARVPSNAGYVWLLNCTNVTIQNCTLSSNLQGILVMNSINTVIAINNIADNVYGIYLSGASLSGYLSGCINSTLIGNTVKNNVNGVYLGYCSRFTTMRNNHISGSHMNFGLPLDAPFAGGSNLVNDIDTSNTVDGKPIVYWIDQHNRQVPTNAGYVMLINSTNILVEDLNLSNNVQSICLLATNDTIIVNNSITNSLCGIDAEGYEVYDQIHYFASFNITVRENSLVNDTVGVHLRSDKSVLSNNSLYGNPLGIDLFYTDNSIISGNVVVASKVNLTALQIYWEDELYIFYYPEGQLESFNGISGDLQELIYGEIGGIFVVGENNTIYGNTVMNCAIGICMGWWGGVFTQYNMIFHNNFIGNTRQALSDAQASSQWDDGYPSGGNYWSDYNGKDLLSGPFQNVTGSDGIGDTPYVIDANNRDRFPYMIKIGGPYIPGDLYHDGKVDMRDIGIAAAAFGSYGPGYLYPGSPASPRWDPRADITGLKYLVPDNKVDMLDIAVIASNFGKKWT